MGGVLLFLSVIYKRLIFMSFILRIGKFLFKTNSDNPAAGR
jgi:hypothetical protein